MSKLMRVDDELKEAARAYKNQTNKTEVAATKVAAQLLRKKLRKKR